MSQVTLPKFGVTLWQNVDNYIPLESFEEDWDVSGLERHLQSEFGLSFGLVAWLEEHEHADENTIKQHIKKLLNSKYTQKESLAGPEYYADI